MTPAGEERNCSRFWTITQRKTTNKKRLLGKQKNFLWSHQKESNRQVRQNKSRSRHLSAGWDKPTLTWKILISTQIVRHLLFWRHGNRSISIPKHMQLKQMNKSSRSPLKCSRGWSGGEQETPPTPHSSPPAETAHTHQPWGDASNLTLDAAGTKQLLHHQKLECGFKLSVWWVYEIWRVSILERFWKVFFLPQFLQVFCGSNTRRPSPTVLYYIYTPQLVQLWISLKNV